MKYNSIKINEYDIINSKRLFDKFNDKYDISKIFKSNGNIYIKSKIKIDEKDDSCSFINILDENIKIDLLYLYKHEEIFRNINEFNNFISGDYIFEPINLFYIKNKIICIEIFNKFFNISLNGFSLYSNNKINLNLLNFDKALELINRELI